MTTHYDTATTAALEVVDQLIYNRIYELFMTDALNDAFPNELETLRVNFPSVYSSVFEAINIGLSNG